ncbi:hypothetical protein FACS1894216_04990 [Synergistales bacterium]|nr:hypothetical protein FACS1894216_04990 [Synergistales bacterium]
MDVDSYVPRTGLNVFLNYLRGFFKRPKPSLIRIVRERKRGWIRKVREYEK